MVNGTIIERFQGDEGYRRLISVLMESKLVANQPELAEKFVAAGHLMESSIGTVIIHQGDQTSDVYFVIAGQLEIRVNGKVVANRFPGDVVGEMSIVAVTQFRAASVISFGPSVLLRICESDFSAIADQFPDVWKRIASTLAKRLAERNHMITAPRAQVRVFIISSKEALPIVDLLIKAFEHDPFLAVAWKNGVFRASNYTIETLEKELDNSDFAIAVAQPDDMVVTREAIWPTMRDNVTFELGLFIGRLGRRRAFLMEPRDMEIQLPSDLTGLTTIPYCYVNGDDAEHFIAPACARIRSLIITAGPKE